MNKICSICENEFDSNSPEKIKVGGLINHCCDCSTETVVPYLGVQAGDGKSSSISILSFKTEEDRERYHRVWQNNSGMHKGKSCQLGKHLSTDPGVEFKTITATGPMNHKGKL